MVVRIKKIFLLRSKKISFITINQFFGIVAQRLQYQCFSADQVGQERSGRIVPDDVGTLIASYLGDSPSLRDIPPISPSDR